MSLSFPLPNANALILPLLACKSFQLVSPRGRLAKWPVTGSISCSKKRKKKEKKTGLVLQLDGRPP